MSYSQLTLPERHRIYILRYQDCLSLRAIGRLLGRHCSTIARECQRNQLDGHYLPAEGWLSATRRKEAKTPFLKVSSELLACIKSALKQFHSPEQIAGRLEAEGQVFVSHETIYKLIYADYEGLGACRKYLRQGRKVRRRRGGAKDKRGLIPKLVDIEFWPGEAEQKQVIGHWGSLGQRPWEGDTVIGANHQGGLVTYVDRASKFLVTGLLKNKKAGPVTALSIRLLQSEAAGKVKTITFDNGKEFSRHQELTGALEAECYFAKPYHCWERGLNEHTNGLLRQFFPSRQIFGQSNQSRCKGQWT
ncbi:glr2008 [Gloeobacter violaceus PCC 7421]|uniref:Glr2008 protein n=1 Tax=Gloeobacter violaceus (strain ATCC 29082 / PCC 7421) TaxID=251221 RepID=Q7NJ24_GLOVI|nr:glr2008 [Gloeobacter violaceus PCC 7421]